MKDASTIEMSYGINLAMSEIDHFFVFSKVLSSTVLADLTEEAFCAFVVIQLKSAKQIIRIL
ncbi:hypothetical protein DXB41_04510 [Segatella copri]|nr:hypothetical protein DXB41_04510 [Segatella copri]